MKKKNCIATLFTTAQAESANIEDQEKENQQSIRRKTPKT